VQKRLRIADAHRGAVGLAHEEHAAAHGHDGEIRGLVCGVRPYLAEWSDRGEDQARVHLGEGVIAQPEALECSRREGFNHEVSGAGQAQEEIPTLGSGKVQSDTAFVRIKSPPEQAAL
jgi:hypothetical protein